MLQARSTVESCHLFSSNNRVGKRADKLATEPSHFIVEPEDTSLQVSLVHLKKGGKKSKRKKEREMKREETVISLL